jgi:diguanylate cyclase (GGDEF)-like protein
MSLSPSNDERVMGILIVDDYADNRFPLKSLLESAGYCHIRTADSAADAFAQLGLADGSVAEPGIDVILMDVMMPGIDGIEACRRIKQVDRFRDLAVLMVTSQTGSRDLEAAFLAGATDYITKPVNVVELLARLRSALTLKRAMDGRKGREQDLLRVTRQLEEANRKLARQSSLDGLTEIGNRRAFDDFLDRAWRTAYRRGEPVALVMIDIDFFKDYNDTFGHQRGDECLKQVAAVLSTVLHRPSDFIGRYGGEEFAAVLAETDVRGAAVVAETLRSRIQELLLVHQGFTTPQRVTISLGVAAAVPRGSAQATQLVAAADAALYAAKHGGRNRVVVAPPLGAGLRPPKGHTPPLSNSD